MHIDKCVHCRTHVTYLCLCQVACVYIHIYVHTEQIQVYAYDTFPIGLFAHFTENRVVVLSYNQLFNWYLRKCIIELVNVDMCVTRNFIFPLII